MSEFVYFRDAETDQLVSLFWQLAQEVHVARQRTLALEEILVSRGVIAAGDVDAYDSGASSRMAAEADALVARLLKLVTEVDDHRQPMRDQFNAELNKG